jgi:hypothetical protein
MERELIEECGLDPRRPPKLDTRIIGFARFVMRGGKPEFFGLTALSAPFSDLKIKRKESVFIADHFGARLDRRTIDEVRRNIHEFRASSEQSFSMPLHLHLRFLDDYLEQSPDDFLRLIARETGGETH